MKEHYYLNIDGQRKGPFSFEELQNQVIYEDTMVWTEGLDKWVKAGHIPMLKQLIRASPPPIEVEVQREAQNHGSSNESRSVREYSSAGELMSAAFNIVKSHWFNASIATFLYIVLPVIVPFAKLIGIILWLIVSGSIRLGYESFCLKMSRGQEPVISDIFSGFQKFTTATGALLLQFVFVLLWSILLIIPGIIAALSYAMTFKILADNPEYSAMHAIDMSKKIMNGHKWRLFKLILRYVLVLILVFMVTFIVIVVVDGKSDMPIFGFFVCGLCILWLLPYMEVALAKFYDEIKEH